MKVEIKKYDPLSEYHKLLEILKAEGEEWKDYVDSKYQEVLKQSITYVAYVNNELCGFSRSINDYGLYIWVIDLLVDKRFRGNSIGEKLIECLLIDYPKQDAFVMSDIDAYYKKLGYRKHGSIFKIRR